MLKKLYCYSLVEFQKTMNQFGWIEENCLPSSVAIISIKDSRTVGDDFESSDNVLNLRFDDVGENSSVGTPLSEKLARECCNFIVSNVDKDFYIHCTAGVSRSQGIVRFILDMWPGQFEIRTENPCITPNMDVVIKLKRKFYEDNGYFEN